MPLRRPASIRSRLILLMLALWLPAVAGLGLQARIAYVQQEQGILDDMQRQARALGFALDAEIDRRVAVGRVLAALPSLGARDLAAFHREARLAMQGTGDTAILFDREQQHVHTGLPAPELKARPSGGLFVERGVGISFVAQGPVSGSPAIAVLVPEAGATPPRFNVGIPFPPALVQEVVQRQNYREGSLVSVIDAQQRVMGRSRDPERWLGIRASHPGLRDLASRGGSGFIRTSTLDGVASLTFVSPPGRHGWAAVVALPEATLADAARQLALRAIAVSSFLLVLGLLLAIVAARRITQPVRALERAAGELLDQGVPAPLATGFTEVDRVGAVLHDAGMRAREWGRELETRVNEAVQETRQAESRLFEARKHEAIGRLTGGIAHDFNNLLQTISMGLQVVQRSVPEGRHSKPLQAALAACGRAADQVKQMLAFGRAQQLQPRAVNLADLLLRSHDLTGKALGERIGLVVRIDPALPPVLADPAQLELALLNLVFNARDAIPGTGTVTLEAAPVDGGEARPMVRIDVRDTGQGMDADTLARVFEPYFTTKPIGSGTGLGLPQVQSFARQSGGDVSIASTPGVGTCVSLHLPAARAAAEGERVAPPHARRSQRALHVLMVEDDVLVASVVVAALEHEGHSVTLCRTADEARTLLVQGTAADVLFTDVMMPGSMTGLELVKWCAEHRPELPALVATGYSARAPEGVWKLLRKPYTVEDLIDALDACCAGAPAVSAP